MAERSPPRKQRKLSAQCSTSTKRTEGVIMASVKKKKVFAQKQPPLSVAIRRILDRYPDGQILKELLQNAEDAGASELRLILDLRQFGEEKLYDKRLNVCQGPALLAYNDAMFTEDDWENIQKTENSDKQIDPKKIGRFGIGFNSIYHLTDFPWTMSGKMIGVFDPCERGIFRDPENGRFVGGNQWDMTDADDKKEIKKMSDQFAPFKYDSFDPEIGSHFNGTLFRFPLRQQFVEPKDKDMMVSKVTYTPKKIHALFKAFETDGDRLLLFLTSVHKVSLWQYSDNNMVELYSVRKEIQFPSTIPKPLQHIGNLCYYEAVITIVQNTGLSSLINAVWSFVSGTNSEKSKRWAIVQYISKDPNVARFAAESELNLLPWIGVACPLDAKSIKADGYISCFLPLPPDNESQTGLPIQVHGYFCLSDSRRSVLWPSAAAQNDHRPKWNELLANQLIPSAYIHLMEQIRERNSDLDSYAMISCLWPNKKHIKQDWKNFIDTFYKQAANKKLFWSSTTNKWVAVSEAVFLDPNVGQDDRKAIEQICSAAKQSIVCVPSFIPNHFKDKEFCVTYVSPKYICGLFKLDPNLMRTKYDVKKQLLNYVLSDCNCSAYLKDVPLLPLADGSFVPFNPRASPIYVSSGDHPRSLLPGLDSMFLSDEYCSIMSAVLASGLTQLRKLQHDDVPKLLVLSMNNGYWKAEKELENLWKYINRWNYNAKKDLTKWQGLSLIPILSENQTFATCNIDPKAPVLSSDGIDSDVCQWLKNTFGLKLALPVSYLKHWLGSQYILNPNMAGSSLKILSQIQPEVVISAVKKANSDSHSCFIWLQNQILMSCTQPFDQNLHTFLAALPLFPPVKGTGTDGCLVSANEAKFFYFRDLRFGIEKYLLCKIGFPFPLISFDSNPLISKLELNEMKMADFVAVLLRSIKEGGYFYENQKSIDLVVSWIVKNFKGLTSSSVTFHDLSCHLVLEQFKKKVLDQDFLINKQSEYANFCALLQNASETIWTEIKCLKLIPCANNYLHHPTRLVMSCGFKNLCPYICEPAGWVKSQCTSFIQFCQIRKSQSLDDMVNIIRNIEEEHAEAQKPLNEKTTLKGFIEVMDEIVKHAKKLEKSQAEIYELNLPLPDNKGLLQHVDKLLYNDLSTPGHSGYLVVHEAVPRHIALHFGAKTLRDVLLEQYEDHDEFGEEFGQEVDLIERIRRLLEQYHMDSDLFQEFLQNADDAGATRIAFFLDKRCHPVKGLVSEQYKELQGSAILIYNNSTFSDDDIRGIQQVGVGSKANDAEKIGRFGAGFNCAYRYTDCPSFLSDDKDLCIFDPMREFLNISRKCGRKFNLSCQSGFQHEFSAVYNTYQVDGFPLRGGTMFRLPLRKIKRKLSLDKALENPESEIYMLFNSVVAKMKEMMLFLRNLREVSAYQSDNHGNFKQMWHFQSKPSDSTWMTKEEFGLVVQKSAKCSPSEIPVTRSSYELLLKADKFHEEKWLVCQRLGFEKAPVSVDFSKVKLLPVAGVATRLDNTDHEHSVFCSLPLPHKTEMPISINGHFSLDGEGRKNLFTSFEGEKDTRKLWNNKLLDDIAVNAYLDLLEVLMMKFNDGKYFSNENPIEKIMKFWTFLPNIKQLRSASAWSRGIIFSYHLFKMFAESDRHLFPCLTRCNYRSSIDWLNLSGNHDGPLFPSHSSFQLVPPDSKFQSAFIQLHEFGIKICPCPPFILMGFSDASVVIPTARPTTVACYLKEPWINLTTDDQKLPCPLADSVFQSKIRVLSLLNFLMTSDEQNFQLTDLGGLPLLVTCDKVLRYFSPSNPAKLEEDDIIQLFSGHADKFICKELRPTLRNYLTQHVDATVTALNLEDLYQLLPGEMLHQGIPIQENKPFCDAPTQLPQKWLFTLWSLINHLITDEINALQFLELFKNFYLIPVKMAKNGSLLLFRIDMRLLLVQPDMWKQISENYTIDGLPIVDTVYFSHIRSSFFSQMTPEKLSDCLVYWNQLGYLKWPLEVRSKSRIAYGLLGHFAKFSSTSHRLNSLRNLPIFETFDGQFVSLMNQQAFTLDGRESLPSNGQNIWMSKALFLKKHYNFMSLYKNLNIGHIALAELYADFIIPSFPEMTTTDQVVHLCYLNDHYKLNEDLVAALQILKETQFIQAIDGNLKSVNRFYDHTVPLFREMCSHDDFLPQYFFEALRTVEHNWLKVFLHKLGLKLIPKPEDHVKFASQLSKLPLETNLEKIERVSKLLLDSVAFLTSHSEFTSGQWNSSLTQLSNIKFIPSMKFDENLRILFPSTGLDSVQLMKTNGSCSSKCNSLVWTVTRVLPDWVPQKLYEKMGIVTLHNGQCLGFCIEHFEKVLSYLFLAKLQQQKDGVNSEKSKMVLKRVLNEFYRFLTNLHSKGALEDNDRLKLMKLPLVFVDGGRHLAYPEMTVERLPTSESNNTSCYAPFLYELPHLLHEYEDLFHFLGMQHKSSVWHYIMYLNNVHDYLHEDGPKSNPNLLETILSVQHAMVSSADKTVDWNSIESVYLFSSDGKLHRSSELVFRDSAVDMQICVPKNNSTLKFWECSPNPDAVLLKKMAEFVELLPGRFKLKLSSEVLAKFVSVEKSEICKYDEPCPAVDRLTALFCSAEFLECIQRLYSDAYNSFDLKDKRKWAEVDKKLQNIQIHCYSKLIIGLKDLEHSEVLDNTDEECECFLNEKGLHISHEDAAHVKVGFGSDLAHYLQQILCMELREMALYALIVYSADPCDLRNILDKLHVPPFVGEFFHVACLPVIGSPVPAEMIHFLEMHPLNYFQNGEFVAFLQSDIDGEAEADPRHNFIWAKIICCIDEDSASALCRHYKINIGDSSGPIIASALDLHKFITQTKGVELGPLVPTDIEPEPDSQSKSQMPKRYNKDLTEEEACKEVTQILEEAFKLPANEYLKVLRRLFLTWHPDKNTEDKKALSTVVFQHLQNEIRRLEKGGTVNDSSRNQTFHRWDFFRANTNQRWNDFSHGRSRNPFDGFDFGSQTPYEQPDPHMADKYWRTANDDLKAAFDARHCHNSQIGKEIGNEHVIILAQQAVEKALKAALFAEIGTAEKHHRLTYFAQRVADRTRCSKDIIYKVSKFVSECGADLTQLRYPDGHVSRPHDTYTATQAIKAVDYAREIVEDLRKAFPAFKL